MTDKNHINVALIGFNMNTAAFVKSVTLHATQRSKASPPCRFQTIGDIEAYDIRFASVFAITRDAFPHVGQKLSNFAYREEHWCEPVIISQSALASHLEMTGGNPNTQTYEDEKIEGMIMGGQNPIVRPLPVDHPEEDDEPVLNTDNLIRVIEGKTTDGDVNEALRADVVIISLPDANEELRHEFNLTQVTKALADAGVPFYVLHGTTDSDEYASSVVHYGDLPCVSVALTGQMSSGFISRLLTRELRANNVTIEHFSHQSKRLPARNTHVSGYAEMKGFGNQPATISFSMTFDLKTCIAASLFDVIRFLYIAKQNNLTERLDGVERVYGITNDLHTENDLRECEALATNNLMALGEFYTSSNGTFIHK